jgi:hypothetical protein
MQLIVAIDGDQQQAAQLAALVRRLNVELIQTTSAGDALQSLGDRVPDLIMTSPLLSPFDDGVLAEYLRDLGPAAAHVQTLRIPVFASAPKASVVRSLFSLRRKQNVQPSTGCDPNVFGEEIAEYLKRAATERQAADRVARERSLRQPAATERAEDERYQGVAADANPVPTEPESAEWTPPFVQSAHGEAGTWNGAESRVDPALMVDASLDAEEAVRAPEPQWEPVTSSGDARFDTKPIASEPVAYLHAVIDSPSTDEPSPLYVAAAPVDEPVTVVDPAPAVPVMATVEPPVSPRAIDEPLKAAVTPAVPPASAAVDSTSTERSSSFEAALAAIRAAWASPSGAGAPGPRPVSAPAASAAPVRSQAAVFTVAPAALPVHTGAPETETPAVRVSLPDATRRKAAPRKRPEAVRPVRRTGRARPAPAVPLQQDEWGVFDPSQCGFSALVSKLDEVADIPGASADRRAPARVISFS